MKTSTLAAASILALMPAAHAQPPEPTGSSVPGSCTWEWKTGGGIGIWAERCDLQTGVWEPRFEASLPGFVLTVDGEDQGTILQVFDKPADADISAILPELRKKGYIPDDDDCVFEPAAIRPAPRTIAFYEIRPIGARLAAFEATPSDEVPDPPCGEYGWSTHGVRYFFTDTRFPERVIYVNTGQDGTMFDDTTITLE
ncbi:MAG TPA: hypothetical protein VFK86_06585 [Bauldia sp.]|nr:hypothetical protein [Bauldia sp.]